MALKSINDRAAAFGAKVRDLVNKHVSAENKVAASALLTGLGGGEIADAKAADALMAQLVALAPEPDAKALQEAAGGMLDDTDIVAVQLACRLESARRFAGGYTRDRMPSNDI